MLGHMQGTLVKILDVFRIFALARLIGFADDTDLIETRPIRVAIQAVLIVERPVPVQDILGHLSAKKRNEAVAVLIASDVLPGRRTARARNPNRRVFLNRTGPDVDLG